MKLLFAAFVMANVISIAIIFILVALETERFMHHHPRLLDLMKFRRQRRGPSGKRT